MTKKDYRELITEYFPEISEAPFSGAKEERETLFRFLDMVCLLAVNQNDNAPEEGTDRIGAYFSDEGLMRALEPHEAKPFPGMMPVRLIFRTLLLKGQNALSVGISCPLSALMYENMLSSVECFALLMAFASSVNRKYERIFGVLQEEKEGILRPTVGLCHDLCRLFLTEEENDISDLMDPDTMFNELMLASWDNQRGDAEVSRPLYLRQQVLNFLLEREATLGDLSFFAAYGDPVSESSVLVHPEEAKELSDVYDNMLAAGEQGHIEVIGGPGSGRKFLLRHLASRHGQPILFLNVKLLLLQPAEMQMAGLSDAVLKAILENAILTLVEIPDKPENAGMLRHTLSFMEKYMNLFFMVSGKNLPEALSESMKGISYRLTVPDAGDSGQIALWREAAAASNVEFGEDVSLEELVSKYTMNPGRIFEAVKNTVAFTVEEKESPEGEEAPEDAETSGKEEVSEDAEAAAEEVSGENTGTAGKKRIRKDPLEEQIRRICAVQFGDNAKRLTSPFVWKDLVVDEASEKMLRMACDRIRFKSKVNDEFGFGKKIPYGRGVAIVLYGPPGTGKTMAAQVLAKELGLDIYRIDLSQISSKYIGETEKNLGSVFDAAKNSNVILFFDEADSLFAKRTAVSSSNDKHANAETAYLLQKIEEYAGLSILATNNLQNFDAAFKRRMTFTIPIGIPNEETRKTLWQQSIPKAAPLSPDVDFDVLARAVEISGSNIKSSCIDAAYRAAARGGKITMRDLAEAVDRECMKIGRMGAKNDILRTMAYGK